LILIALIGYWSVYSSTTHRTPVLVTTHSLPAGATLRASDLRTAELAGDASAMASLVPERRLDEVIGRRLAAALPAGTPLPASALSAQTPSSSALTLAVPVLHALGGALQPGDRVTVLATFGARTGQARTRAIARGPAVPLLGSVADAGELAELAANGSAQAVLLSADLAGVTPAHCERARALGLRVIGVATDGRDREALKALAVDATIDPECSAARLESAVAGTPDRDRSPRGA